MCLIRASPSLRTWNPAGKTSLSICFPAQVCGVSGSRLQDWEKRHMLVLPEFGLPDLLRPGDTYICKLVVYRFVL